MVKSIPCAACGHGEVFHRTRRCAVCRMDGETRICIKYVKKEEDDYGKNTNNPQKMQYLRRRGKVRRMVWQE